MPGGVKRNKGNKKLGSWDRLIVPSCDYRLPPDYQREKYIDYPTEPVGIVVVPKTLILYEISPTFEADPRVNIHRIPFSEIIGDWSNEILERGYELTTNQGEILLIKWSYIDSDIGKSRGLIIHVKDVLKSFPFYDTDWGHLFGIAMEWETLDKKRRGRNWADRILGYTTESSGTIIVTTADKSPYAIRPELMLGYPAKRTIQAMGNELPLRIFPAVGKPKTGILLGFNKNVMDFIRKPLTPYIYQTGAGTAYGDVVSINWQRDDFASKSVVSIKFIENTPLKLESPRVTTTNPELNVEYDLINPTDRPNGRIGITIYYPSGTKERYVYEMRLYEWDDQTNSKKRLIACARRIEDWGGTPRDETCGGGMPIIIPDENKTRQLSYFCDNSIDVSTINTDFWVGRKDASLYGVRKTFWEGRNDWLNLFGSPYNKSVINITNFNYYLYKFYKDVLDNNEFLEQQTWTDFKKWADSNLPCLNDFQKGSIYATYKIKTICNFFPSAIDFLNGNYIDKIAELINKTHTFTYDWIDFNDVETDNGEMITGAFAVDVPFIPQFNSYINIEPQALLYSKAAAIAHRPYDYVIPPGEYWGQAVQALTQYYLPDFDEINYKPYVVAEVVIHEIGHAVAYYGKDFYGIVLHEHPEWLQTSGWSSPDDQHLAKTQPGFLADNGKEAPVSDYGCFNPAEDFAEAYRMYILNPRYLSETRPKKFEFMEKYVSTLRPI